MKVVAVLALISVTLADPLSLPSQWHKFKETHKKTYKHPLEEARRFKVFVNNVKKINKHNALYDAGLVTYQMGINKFADMTAEEFEHYLGLSGPLPAFNESDNIFEAPKGADLPDTVDYRKKNVVNEIKDQGQCGSCWAFSAVGALESINALKSGKLLSLSEQNLVDCSSSYGNHGCRGGSMDRSYNYTKANGIESETDYPYTARDGSCKFVKSKSVLKVSGYTKIAAGSEQALQAAVATIGPIAVAVDALLWQFYFSGIFSTPGSYRLNHGVVAIGYGAEKSQDYWIVRNSWGKDWGEQGYIRVARNKNNLIGISSAACYPTL